jgi:hypothetical protein
VLGPNDNLVLLLVMDVTGDLERLDSFRQALEAELAKFRPRHYVGLLRAQDALAVLEEPTADRKLIVDRVAGLPLGGKSALLDTIEAASDIAGGILGKAAVRVAVLYVTDSSIADYRDDFTNPVINASDYTDLSRRFPDRLIQERVSQLVAALESCQVPIFVLHLQDRPGRLEEAYQNGLKEMAETTAGRAVFCRTAAEIPASLEQMLERVRSVYVVALDAGARARRGLRIRIAARPNDRLSFRNRLDLKPTVK